MKNFNPGNAMGKLRAVLCIAMSVFLTTSLKSQVTALYSFTQNVAGYTPISGGTLWLDASSPSMDDVVSSPVAMPTFWYDGNFYNSIQISTNGFVVFGATAPSATEYSPISSVATYSGCIAPFADNLDKATSGTPEIRYEQVGSEFVIQWQDVCRAGVAGENVSFQVRLDSITNLINVVYGGTIVPGNNAVYPQVGLRGPNNSFANNVNNRRVASFTGAWVNSLAGLNNSNRCFFSSSTPSTIPAVGTTFTWTPSSIDMGVTTLASPLSTGCYGNNQTVSITVKNNAFATIDFSLNPLTINCNVMGPNPISFPPFVVSSGTLASGASQAIVISTTYDMSLGGSYSFDANCFVAGDNNSANDLMPTTPIFVTPAPSVSLGADISQCGSGTIVLDAANAGDTYLWNDNSTNQTLSVTTTGIYNVLVTDGNGCTGADTISITFNTIPTVDLGADVTQCGGTVTLDAGNPGDTYDWSDGSHAQTLTVSTSGTYSVMVMDPSGCMASDNVVVTINTVPTVDLGADVTQCGGTVTLDAGNPGDTYDWSDGSHTQTLTVSTSGTYSVMVMDPSGCMASDNVVVTINTVPTVDLGVDITQCGGTVTLDAGNPGDTYDWSDGSHAQTLTVSSSGTYSVMVMTPSGCMANDDINVTINSVPTVDLGADVTQCGGTVTLDAGNSGSTYLWSDNSTAQTLTVSATGTYSVMVTNASGCNASDAVVVTINSIPVVNLGADITQCGGSATLDAGNIGSTYLWSDNSTAQTLTVSTSGTYSVMVTNASGCFGSDVVDVTINSLPTVDLGPDITQCGGSVTLDAGNTGATYLWSDNSTAQTLTVSSSGTYSVLVTGTNGCNASDAINVTIGSNPVVNLGADITQCGGSATLDAGNIGSTYLWSDNSTAQTLTVSSSGTYSVMVTNASGCFGSDVVDVTINSLPTVDLGADITQCGGSVTLDAGNTGATYLWSDNSTAQTLPVSSSGTYSVLVTGTNGCNASDVINVAIGSNPVVNLGADITQCGGTATLDAGNIGSTYLWSDNSTAQTLTVSTSGTYSVMVTNASGCFSSDVVDVTINSLPTVDLGPDITQCGGTVTLDAGNTGATYLWSDNSTAQTLTVSSSGTYSVLVTGTNGCNASDVINIAIGSNPVVNLGADITQCGGTATLDAGNIGSTYLWSDNSTAQTLTVSTSGTYSVMVTNASGCIGSDVVDVTINSLPTVDLGPDITQCGGSATLDAGNTGATYLWSDNSTSQTLTVSSSGTYSVLVTGTNGCNASDAINVTIGSNPVVNLGADITQCGGTATLDAGNIGSTYLWSDNSTAQTLTVSSSGTYSVMVTNASGCIGSDVVDVTINSLPTVDLGPDITQCGGSATLDAGNTGATYLWSDNSTSQTLTVSSSGTYSVLVTGTNGCNASDAINVTIGSNPVVNLGADITQCGGTATLDAGNIGSTYLWSDNSTAQTLTVSSSGTYSVMVTNASGCFGSDVVDVTINAVPLVALGADITQCGGTVTLDAGNPGSTYLWSDNSTTQTLTASSTGTYSVVVTGVNGCNASDVIDVTINSVPTVALGADITQCGGTVTLDAGNVGATYLWSTGATTQTITASTTATYSVTVTNAGGCTATDAIDVTINAIPVVALGADNIQCGGTMTLDAGNPGSTYLWNDNSTAQTLTVSSTGTYSVVVTNASGCNASDAIEVTINPVPTVALGADITQCGGTVTLDAGNVGATYLWSDNSTAQMLTVSTTGTYSVTVTNASGCSATDAIDVTINAIPVVAFGADITQCGGTTTLDAGNVGATYLWNDNSTAQTLLVSSTGTYSVTVTSAAGCTNTDVINVTINPTLAVNLGADVTVCSGTVALDAGNPGETYLWSSGATTQNIVAAATGIYWVDVTNSFGCTTRDSVSITINSNPVVALGADITQCGGTVTLDAGNPGAAYLWSDNSTNQTLTVSTSGTYSVLVTLTGGCTATDAIDVTINTPPTVTINFPMDTVCLNGGIFTLSGESPAGGTWSGTGVTNNTFDPLMTGVGIAPITYTYTDANGCSSSDTQNLTVDLCNDVAQNGMDVNQVQVYPNPNAGSFFVTINALDGGTFTTELFGTDGKLVMSQQVRGNGMLTVPFNMEGMANGMYFLKVTNGNGQQTTLKVVNQK